ncbi:MULTISPECIES: efflux RND transporter periplasmic adaptor subunit [unclassified Shinella]|jgi:HlyD family secretion protein|uniref:efflux RND transporter periplasmic adaptor subunit n=1 Tax=unclassified Shinella TaxID=2643062 RepID=UPI0009E826EE|nr:MULTISPECIES: efflux RND transporter periplasmic adaptor subunit [unclassified Shinella]MCO5150840.1 efflux RND transporter periplasmic adaptor subunit [Shinella sp.]MDC7263149.1 efflux RND transporter periplasmic adaptor subunit [Shinella sp. HY16]MDC7270044.1 efflux RND transporter periplasmic adaptor subunit [Shinella sp. YZ44]TAA65034.1 efflux RND transporter periplasmic adaptor subunit [Shinella sp. JR1-6]
MASGRRKVLSFSVATFLTATPLFAFAADPAEGEAGKQQAQNLPAIVVTAAETRPLTDRVLATGSVQAVEDVYVTPLVDGLSIRTLAADVGDRVEADGTLATLNDDALVLEKSQTEASLAKANAALAQIHAQLVEAKANADEAVRVRDRAQRLVKSGSQSQAAADQAVAAADAALARVNSAKQAIAVSEADIKVAQSQIDDIDLRLARTAVKSPVAGIVSARTAKIGAIASGAAAPLFTVIRDGEIELKADVSEDGVLKLAPGQKATVTLAGGAATLTGTIRLVEPTLDPASRLGRVFIRFDEPGKARAGMFASAEIIVEEKQGIVLPLSAITTAGGKTVARKVENGVVKLVPVETGIQDGQGIEIVSGLTAGDEVVAKAGAYVRDGDRVNPVHAEQASATK